jgi:autotransporter-associated beta strand protein
MGSHHHSRIRRAALLGCVSAAALLLAAPAAAQSNWDGSANNSWFGNGNWTPIGVPTAADNVTVQAGPPHFPPVSPVIQGGGAVALSVDVNGLSLEVTVGGTLTVSNALSVVNGGTFTAHNGATVTVNSGLEAVRVNNAGTATIDNATLTIAGDVEVGVFGPNPGSQLAVVNGGAVDVGSGTRTVFVGGEFDGTLQIGNGGTAGTVNAATIALGTAGSRVLFQHTGATTFAAAITDQGRVEVTGTGTTILTGANTYAGGTTITAGTLQIGNGGTSGTLGAGGVVDNATLAFNRSDTLVVANEISGTGAVNQIGTGTTVLTGANTYTGVTTITTGTLQIGNGGASGTLGAGGVVNLATLAFNRSDTLVVSNDISGAGAVNQVGNGTTILTGANSYLGGTTITAGTLQIGNGGTTGSIVGDVLNNGTLAFNRSNALTLAGTISGTGAVNQIGNGTTILTGANSYAGVTTIAAGTLQIGNGGTAGTLGTGAVVNNATLAFNRSDALVVANDISGAGTLMQSGAGTTALTGSNTYTGATEVLAGTLQAGAANVFGNLSAATVAAGATLDLNGFDQALGSLAGAGSVMLGAATLTAGGNDATTTFSGVISGAGGLVKAGLGTLTLTGANTYTGATTVDAGTLRVNGSIATSSLTRVNAGAILGGTGIVGNTSINGGTLSPGASIGTIAVQGNLAFSTAATYLVEVSSSAADRTQVSGTAKLAGTVNAQISDAGLARRYTILSAAGGLGGTTFGSLNTDSLPANLAASLSYTGTDVILNLAAALGSAGGLNRNQQAVATTIDAFFNAGGTLPSGFVTLFGLSGPSLGHALTQLSGEHGTGFKPAGNLSTGMFLNLMLDPFVSGRDGAFGAAMGFAPPAAPSRVQTDAESAMAAALPVKAYPPVMPGWEQRWNVWGAAYGGRARRDGDPLAGSNDLSANTAGAALGADYRVAPGSVLGVATAIGETRWRVAGLGSGRAEVAQVGGYASTRWNAFYVSAAAAFAWHRAATDRTLAVAGIDRLEADFDAKSLGARLEAGRRFGGAHAGVTPYAAVQVQRVRTPAYSEAATFGSNQFALAYRSQATTDTRSELGAWADTRHTLADGAQLMLRGRAAWVHDFDPGSRINAAFQTLPGTSFTAGGAAAARDAALASAVAELRLRNGWTFAAKVDGEFAHDAQTLAGTGSARYAW